MPRAAWFIKLSSAYTVAVSEAKIKKRQLPDPTTGKLLVTYFNEASKKSLACENIMSLKLPCWSLDKTEMEWENLYVAMGHVF